MVESSLPTAAGDLDGLLYTYLCLLKFVFISLNVVLFRA